MSAENEWNMNISGALNIEMDMYNDQQNNKW